MSKLNVHINFNGNAEEAFNFYKSIFGGEFSKIVRFIDIANDNFVVSEQESNKIMLIELPIGENFLRANDIPEIMGKVNENENRSKISISAENKEQAFGFFNLFSVNGIIEIPMTETQPSCYFGMLRDKFGIEWIIEYNSKLQ